MIQNEVLAKIKLLPPDAQKQVLEFINFLEKRYKRAKKQTVKTRFREEKFLGMWKHRVDLRDSEKWLKRVRREEWGEDV